MTSTIDRSTATESCQAHRKTVFLGIAFGTSIRDVLRTDTFQHLRSQEDIDIVVFLQDITQQVTDEFKSENVYFEKLLDYRLTWWERVVSNLHKTVLREKCKTIDLGNTSGDTSSIDKITPFVRFLRLFLSYEILTKLIFALYKLGPKRTEYIKQFEKYKPAMVVVTRVLNFSRDYPLLRTAASLNIPVMGLVSSWDNLTSKAFFPFQMHTLFVWNNVLKDEAFEIFGFPKERIFVSGIPRYDSFFRSSAIRTKKDFCEHLGLAPNRKIIFYGTGSATTGRTQLDLESPEPEIVSYLADQMNSGAMGEDLQLLVRLHPQANPQDYEKISVKENVLLHIPGRSASFQDRLFSQSDDQDFYESLYYSSVVVNLASTISIDAATFDKPIVCIYYDHRGERPYKCSVRRLYDFDHYAKLRTTGGFELAESRSDLVEKIRGALNYPHKLKDERARMVEQQCVFTDGKAGLRVGCELVRILRSL